MVKTIKYLLVALLLTVALIACEEATPPKPNEPTPAAAPGNGAPASPAGAEPTAGGNPPPTVAPTPGGAPALPRVANNIVMEITAGERESTRSASIVSLPQIEGTRQESVTVGGKLVTAKFPEGFTYTRNAEYDRHIWNRRLAAPAITQAWQTSGGTVVVTYSLDGGASWVRDLDYPARFYTTEGFGIAAGETAGYVYVDVVSNGDFVEEPGPDQHPHRASGQRNNGHPHTHEHPCNTTASSLMENPPVAHPVHLTIKQGSNSATAVLTLASGVVTAAGGFVHKDGSVFGGNAPYSYEWTKFWGIPQTGEGATFTPVVTANKLTALTVTAGGKGYSEPCSFTASHPTGDPSRANIDEEHPGYWLTSRVQHAIRYYGSGSILVRFAVIVP